MVRRERQQHRFDNITQDRMVGIARAGQDGEHHKRHNRVEDRKGQNRGRACPKGKTEWKARVRPGNGIPGQGRATYGRARNGLARQEQGQEHIQRRAWWGSGRTSGRGRGMSRLKAGQDRAG